MRFNENIFAFKAKIFVFKCKKKNGNWKLLRLIAKYIAFYRIYIVHVLFKRQLFAFKRELFRLNAKYLAFK